MKKEKLLIGIWIFLLVPTVYASGSVWTGYLNPSELEITQHHIANITITAMNIWNREAVELLGVNATLIVPEDSGLIFLTPQTVNIGNISNLSRSPVSPIWILQYNGNSSGEFILYVNYSTSNGFCSSSQDQATTIIRIIPTNESNAPKVLEHYPKDKVRSTHTTLVVTTNRNAICKYSLEPGIDYKNMSKTFSKTGGTSHEEVLKNLAETIHHYYVRCRDESGNTATEDYDATFEVDAPPSATITLSDRSPVQAGLLKVRLTTSEDVQPTPTLKYSLKGSSFINIPLSGSGTTWEGYMIIDKSEGNKVGSFIYSGVDYSGNMGTLITRGKTFIVDTVAPDAPTAVMARSRGNGDIEIEWHQSEKDVSHFNIYRSEFPGVSDNDFYFTTNSKSFIDRSTTPGTTYYYRITAVDEAGNEGKFSNEVSVTSVIPTTENVTRSEEKENLHKENQAERIENITKKVIDLSNKIDSINLKVGLSDEAILDLLRVNQRKRECKVELMNLQRELNDMVSEGYSIEHENKLRIIDNKINELKGTMPKIILTDELESFESTGMTNEDDIKHLIKKLGKNASDELITEIIELQNKITIYTKVTLVTMVFMNNSKRDMTLVNKKVVVENNGEIENAFLVEQIPKQAAVSADGIRFQGDYEVIESDPVIRFPINNLERIELSYIINHTVSPELIRNTNSIIIITNFAKEKNKPLSKAVGFSFLEKIPIGNKPSPFFIGTFIGVIITIILLFVYFKQEKELSSMRRDYQSFLLMKEGLKKQQKVISSHTERSSDNYRTFDFQKSSEANLLYSLEQAHNYINQLNFYQAKKLYSKILSKIGAISNCNRQEQERFQRQIKKLYAKLVLYLNINKAYQFLRNKQYSHLRNLLNEIAKLYNSMIEDSSSEEMQLLTYVKHYYNIYYRILTRNSNQ